VRARAINAPGVVARSPRELISRLGRALLWAAVLIVGLRGLTATLLPFRGRVRHRVVVGARDAPRLGVSPLPITRSVASVGQLSQPVARGTHGSPLQRAGGAELPA
jgi:hypothetical protein